MRADNPNAIPDHEAPALHLFESSIQIVLGAMQVCTKEKDTPIAEQKVAEVSST
jgi:hypothetical protein